MREHEYSQLPQLEGSTDALLGASLRNDASEEGAKSSTITGDRATSFREHEIRPFVYYEEGPFDAPSSDSEDELFEKDGVARHARDVDQREDGFVVNENQRDRRKIRPKALRWLGAFICSLLLLSILLALFVTNRYLRPTSETQDLLPITMDNVFNGTFSYNRESIRWVPEAGDGVYAKMDWRTSSITLVDLKTNSSQQLVSLRDIKNEEGNQIAVLEWKLSASMKYLLVKTNVRKQWRYSKFGNYYVHEIESRITRALTPPSIPAITAYATWSPTGEAIAFVKENDLYIMPSAQDTSRVVRVTRTGSTTRFNGVPDWVYEEEVFSGDSALWWSPDSNKLAFLELDESDVNVYKFPIYNPDTDASAVHPYTEEVAIRYPKPGYNNPRVDAKIFDLKGFLDVQDEREDNLEVYEDGFIQQLDVDDHLTTLNWSPRQLANDSIIIYVAWVGDNDLILKEVNRPADDGAVVHFDTSDFQDGTLDGNVVRKLGKSGEEKDDGWIEFSQSITRIPASLIETLSLGKGAYLDLVNNSDGYLHIALFASSDSSTPIYLTDGNWEVVGDILGIDSAGKVYFTAAYPTPIQRSILFATIPAGTAVTMLNNSDLTALHDMSWMAWYQASFSPGADFYLLDYLGPDVPWQVIRKTNYNHDEFEIVINNNSALIDTLARYQSPNITYSTIKVDGLKLNAMEIRPYNFDESGATKYPVLFRVYGGPSSQLVDVRFARDWHAYLSCTLNYIVVVVDGRGTGFKGRAFRNPVRNNLGYWEARDQIEAARNWAARKYVDASKIGIWGWSYGGYASSKVAEAGAGVHSLAMAVAPVTDWRLYDSIYTERFMSTPQLNPSGYNAASVSNMTGFHNINFLLAHGSGDDNVHFANSAHLLDLLTATRVRGFRFRMFTDSDHSIRTRGAYRELHEWMTEFLLEKWGKVQVAHGSGHH